MAALCMMKLSEAMLFEMSEVVFAGMAERAFPEMMGPAVFKMAVVIQPVIKMAAVEIIGIITNRFIYTSPGKQMKQMLTTGLNYI
jgi:hypothetical protein